MPQNPLHQSTRYQPLVMAAMLFLIGAMFTLTMSCGKTNDDQPDMSGFVGVDTVLAEDGVPIVYEVIGGGDKAVVLIHGWSCDRTYWRHQVDMFSKNYRLIAVDLAGHGESGADRTDWSIATCGGDVASVVNKLGISDVVLVGHSMGGTVMLEAARRLEGKVRALVGVDNHQQLDRMWDSAAVDRFAGPMKANFKMATIDFVHRLFPPFNRDSQLVDWVANDMAETPPEVAIPLIYSNTLYRAAETLKELDLPLYSINSELYPTDTAAAQAILSHYRFKLIRQRGHFIQLEDPEEFNRCFHEVLSEIWSAANNPGE